MPFEFWKVNRDMKFLDIINFGRKLLSGWFSFGSLLVVLACLVLFG